MLFWLLPLAKLVLHLATYHGYGDFRDELYYRACSEHMAWGYVDHPALSIAVLWVVRHLFGDSLFVLRAVPALVGALTVAVIGGTAKVLGGGQFAQALAMTSALIAGSYLSLGFFYSMNCFDLLFWALAGYLLARLLAEPDPTLGPRFWVLLGVVLGLGLLNKVGVLWLGAGLFAGLLLTPARRSLLTPWPFVTALLAVLGLWPYLRWQVQNDWSTLEWMHNATTEKMMPVSPLEFLGSQLDAMHPWNVVVWGAGLFFLLGNRAGKPFRLLGWIWVAVATILAASGASRAGYLAPAYAWVFAAGGVQWERWLARLAPRRARALRVAGIAVLLAGGAIAAPFAMPLLPVDDYVRYAKRLGVEPSTEEKKELGVLPQFYADMHGWPEIVDAVAKVYDGLPEPERAHAAIFVLDYGVAGAIDDLGPARGLPHAISGHNNYFLWGPRDFDGSVLIMVGSTEARMRRRFEEVERAGTVECGLCMPYENHRPIWVARRIRVTVPQLWFTLKHFD